MAAKASLVPQDSLYELAFDQFSRQYLVKTLVEQLRTKKKLRILDVGGNNGQTHNFFPADEVLVVDLYDKVEPGYLKASALDLPFEDKAFDVVVSFDVYEHIAADDRDQFMKEVTRVSRLATIIAAPFDTESVAKAEIELNDYYRRLNKTDHRWLQEHIDNTLPKVAQIEKFITKQSLAHQVVRSNNLLLWTAMQNFIFLADSVKAPERISNLNRFYNQHLTELGDSLGPSYRQIYLITPKPVTITKAPYELFDANTLRGFINMAAGSMNELIYGSEPIRSQAQQLAEKDRQIAELTAQLNGIRGSRPYKVARVITRAKRKLMRQ